MPISPPGRDSSSGSPDWVQSYFSSTTQPKQGIRASHEASRDGSSEPSCDNNNSRPGTFRQVYGGSRKARIEKQLQSFPSAPPRSRQSYPVRQIYGAGRGSADATSSLFNAPSLPSVPARSRTDSASPSRLRSGPTKKFISLVPSEDGGSKFCLVATGVATDTNSSDNNNGSNSADKLGSQEPVAPQLGKHRKKNIR